MFWAMAAMTWTTALLSLVSLRYPVPAGLRKALGVAGIIVLVVAAWRWWSGTWSPGLDTGFFVMLGGTVCDELIIRIARRRSHAPQPPVVSGID